MQPTDVQVQRTLDALREPAEPERRQGIPRDTLDLLLAELPAGLLDELREPPVRPDRVGEARHHLEDGDELSSDELANRIVGRLVCDRLR